MCGKLSYVVLLFCGLLVHQSSAQEVLEITLECNFMMHPIFTFNNYACVLFDVEFDFSNPFYYIRVYGDHMPGMTNDDVLNFAFHGSNTNAIPAYIFLTFPNLVALEAMDSGLVAIAAHNFVFGSSLQAIFINFNDIPHLQGAPMLFLNQLTHLSLYSNRIQSISDIFFLGLGSLRYLSLSGNNIQTITPEAMAPLTNLRTFFISSNELATLSYRLFATNRLIENIGFEYNSIDAVGPGMFDDLPNLEFIGMQGNTCIDAYFEFDRGITIDDVNEGLQGCFDNNIPEPPRRRELLFEIRGNMTLFNEYHEEILNVQGRPW